jgi:hypothetical protein
MTHDVLAELDGYRNELANARRYGNNEQAEAVTVEIDRVKADVQARAVDHETRAASYRGDGQDLKAAEQDVEARRYRDALTEPGADPETAVEAPPAETATPGRKRTTGGK